MWGLLPVRGRFAAISGRGDLAADGQRTGEAVIDATSVRTGIKKRDEHLRPADLFDVEQYPQISFTLSGLRLLAPDEAIINGSLHVKGVVRTTRCRSR
ncbi:YceI family protein [Streptomyces malaysiensis]|uniref:YceI family protein n=1 Tax=Streptomyces malaysiensis TaxID=92644 RepID=UPI00352A3245